MTWGVGASLSVIDFVESPMMTVITIFSSYQLKLIGNPIQYGPYCSRVEEKCQFEENGSIEYILRQAEALICLLQVVFREILIVERRFIFF